MGAGFLVLGCASAPKSADAKDDASTQDGDGDAKVTDAGPLDGGDAGITRTLVTEPGEGLTPIYDVIKSAKKTLDMTMYELTDTTVTGLLTTAAKSGVKVRVILDQNLEKNSNTAAYDALSAGNVAVHWADTTYAATHQKTITADGTTSAIMTLNLTPEYYATSRDFAVVTTDPADVAAIELVFGDDFTNTAVTPPVGDDLVWSPTNSESSMLALINGAKTSLVIENEEMSDTEVVSALSAAAKRGVHVDVAMTASKSWDANFTTLEAAGVKVVTYARSASLYIHAKVILRDYGTSNAGVFIGSENFSNASLTENRELGVILTDAAILTSVQGTLTGDFNGGAAF
jgi:cardiolipin synthase